MGLSHKRVDLLNSFNKKVINGVNLRVDPLLFYEIMYFLKIGRVWVETSHINRVGLSQTGKTCRVLV